MNNVWQATEARANFATLLDRAATEPQVVRRSGEEYVVLRRVDYEASVPTLKEFLLGGGLRPSLPIADETIDRIFQRDSESSVMTPRDVHMDSNAPS